MANTSMRCRVSRANDCRMGEGKETRIVARWRTPRVPNSTIASTPKTTTLKTVISPSVSNPRKSTSTTLTTFCPPANTALFAR